MKKENILIYIILLCCTEVATTQNAIFKSFSGDVHFISNAPLETIEAASKKLKGAINIRKRTFAFSIPIRSFLGFNNPLQREHFNENYLETQDFNTASFTGKIIEKLDFLTDGEYIVRAKGKLKIHGITRERIIKGKIEIKKGKIYIHSTFTVLLKEHKIRIPKIVQQKIAKEVLVTINAVFEN